MSLPELTYPSDKKSLYFLLKTRLIGLIDGIPYRVSNLANTSALLYEALPDINWAGFYLTENDRLILGPFQGRPACVEIAAGCGVCGTAAQQNRTLLVANVHEFPGHIACDSASNSEIVIPIHEGGRVIGVLDIDSPILSRFDEADRQGLEQIVKTLEEFL
ncbi:MAG: GAF domain-containing protein [Coprococcus sp.]|nr:GAF domain-containing protein [Coprococcus sp.]